MFSRLNWKLTFSYTLVTVGTLVVLGLCALLGFQLVASTAALGWTVGGILQAEAVPQVREALSAPGADGDKLGIRLQLWFPAPGQEPSEREILPLSPDGLALLLDGQGRPLAKRPTDPAPNLQNIPGLTEILPAALTGSTDLTQLTWREGELLTAALPVTADDGSLLAVLVIHTRQTRSLTDNLNGLLQLLGLVFALITCLAGVIGTLFGFFTARWLTRRLKRVSTTAAAWGQGDFSQTIRDNSRDELGQLAGQLNAMSAQLQEVMSTRQQLAALDERNRLARDLHDSVKQQVFAIRMNLGAIQTLWEQNPEKARARLDAALKLTEQAQQELTELISALRPGALENKTLAEALPELLGDWEKAHSIQTTCRVECPVSVPAPVEQALFRITQEALANIAKHSGAKSVTLELTGDATRLALRIADDGHGFDASQPALGLGLRSMRERVQAIGGSLEIVSDKQGTQLVISVPTGVSHAHYPPPRR